MSEASALCARHTTTRMRVGDRLAPTHAPHTGAPRECVRSECGAPSLPTPLDTACRLYTLTLHHPSSSIVDPSAQSSHSVRSHAHMRLGARCLGACRLGARRLNCSTTRPDRTAQQQQPACSNSSNSQRAGAAAARSWSAAAAASRSQPAAASQPSRQPAAHRSAESAAERRVFLIPSTQHVAYTR